MRRLKPSAWGLAVGVTSTCTRSGFIKFKAVFWQRYDAAAAKKRRYEVKITAESVNQPKGKLPEEYKAEGEDLDKMIDRAHDWMAEVSRKYGCRGKPLKKEKEDE